MTDPAAVAWHEAGHAVMARLMGIEVDVVSIRQGAAHDGVAIVRSGPLGPTSDISWWMHPDLGPVVRELTHTLAGEVAEGLAVPTGRVPAPSGREMGDAFHALSSETRSRLANAESAATPAISDQARAWELATSFCGDLAIPFLDLVRAEVRARVNEHAAAIAAVAEALIEGSVLDGAAVDTILAVGELVEANDGRPTSGMWMPIVTTFVGEIEHAARVGEALPWHDARVQGAPEVFLPAESPEDVIRDAETAYLARATAPPKPPTGRPTVACVRRLIARCRDGRLAVLVNAGEEVPSDSWWVRRWPDYFERDGPKAGSNGPSSRPI